MKLEEKKKPYMALIFHIQPKTANLPNSQTSKLCSQHLNHEVKVANTNKQIYKETSLCNIDAKIWIKQKVPTWRNSTGFRINSWGLLEITWPNFLFLIPNSPIWSTINFSKLVEQPKTWGQLLIARPTLIFGTCNEAQFLV